MTFFRVILSSDVTVAKSTLKQVWEKTPKETQWKQVQIFKTDSGKGRGRGTTEDWSRGRRDH